VEALGKQVKIVEIKEGMHGHSRARHVTSSLLLSLTSLSRIFERGGQQRARVKGQGDPGQDKEQAEYAHDSTRLK
jgi:hypothetical protein